MKPGRAGFGARTGDPCPGALFQSSGGGPFLPFGTGSHDMVFTVFVEPTPPEPESPAAAGRTLILDANKNRVKKGKKVRLMGQLSAATRQGPGAGQTVELQRRSPARRLHDRRTAPDRSAGSFSTEQKVKKTFVYQAQVPLTATCEGALSNNTEKVKVKKKK